MMLLIVDKDYMMFIVLLCVDLFSIYAYFSLLSHNSSAFLTRNTMTACCSEVTGRLKEDSDSEDF